MRSVGSPMVAARSEGAGPDASPLAQARAGQDNKEDNKEEIGEAIRLEITPEKEEAIRNRLIESNNFPRLLGFVLDSLEPGRAVLSVAVGEQLLQLQGIMHGGAIASLIDTAVALAIAGISEPSDRFTTVEMKVNYLAPIKAGRA